MLNSLAEITVALKSQVSFINHGGCGVTAALMYERLQKESVNFDIQDLHIRFAGSHGVHELDDELEQTILLDGSNLNVRTLGDECGIDCHHAYVVFTHCDVMYAWDGRTIPTPIDEYEAMFDWCDILTIPYAIVKYVANNSTGWNRQFDRSQIPYIECIIDAHSF